MKFVVANKARLDAVIHKVREATTDVADNKRYVISVDREKKDRSGAQNRLAFLWYKQLGEQSGNGKEYERNFCKWSLGFPILLARDEVDPSIEKMYRILMNQPYEARIDTMPIVDVTSQFKVGEFGEYLNSIERYASAGGHVLTHPEDLYWEAIGATRNRPTRRTHEST